MSESDFKLRREDPPAPTPRGRKSGQANKIDREVAHMKKNVGTWFKVRENAAAGVYQVYTKRGCKTRTKSLGDGRYDIWAKWPADTDED